MSQTDARRQIADHFRSALASAVEQAISPTAVTSTATASGIEGSPHSPARSKSLAFSPEMVRAILDGRKTQTRRLIRPAPKNAAPRVARCVIAQPHDLLAVREAWAEVDGQFVYAADEPESAVRFKPAMYMPREASRLTLRVTRIEPQRLQQITPADAMAEGCPADHADPVVWFAALWDRLFTLPGERWADDPWVWVVHFERGRETR